ncbi:MAG: ankyrin repeat domain-containing protein [Parachlamydiales bacterium]
MEPVNNRDTHDDPPIINQDIHDDPPIINQDIHDDPPIINQDIVAQPKHVSPEIDLREQIQKLVLCRDLFGENLRKVKKWNLPDLATKYLGYPEMMLDLKGVLLDQIRFKELKPKDPIFFTLHEAIRQLGKMKGLTLEQSQLVECIKTGYQEYISNVCQTSGKARIALIKGDAHLQTMNDTYKISRKIGRQLISWGKYDSLPKKNAYGSSIVSQVGNIHAKKQGLGGELNPGKEYAIDLLKNLLLEAGGTPTEIVVVKNVFYHNATGPEYKEDLKKKHATTVHYDQRLSFEEIFASQPELKDNYPFVPTREESLLQISRSVDGKNFFDVIQQGKAKVDNFTLVMLLDAIVGASDSRSDNFMYHNGILTCIDQDHGLDPEVEMAGENHFLGIKSLLFCLPEMDERPDPNVMNHLAKIEPATLLISWLHRLDEQNTLYNRLKEEKVLRPDEFENCHFPFMLPDASVLPRLYQLLLKVQKGVQAKPKDHWALLEGLYPVLTACMKEVKKKSKQDLVRAQDLIFDWDSENKAKLDHPMPIKTLLPAEEFEKIEPILPKPEKREKLKPVTLSEAMESLLWVCPTPASLLNQLSPEIKLGCLPIHDPNLSDKELDSALLKMKWVKRVTLFDCPRLTAGGIQLLLNHRKDLEVTLGDGLNLDDKGIQTVVNEAVQHGQKLSFQLTPHAPPFPIIDGSLASVQELHIAFIQAALLKKENLARGLKLLGVNPNAPMDVNALMPFFKGQGIAVEGLSGRSLMHLAVMTENHDLLQFLLSLGLPLPAMAGTKITPYHVAAQRGNLIAIAAIGNAGHPIDHTDSEGLTPLLWAIKGQQEPAISALIAQKANLNVVTSEKKTILHLACEYGPASIVKLLLEKGCIPQLSQQDDSGRLPLHYACYGVETPDVVELLIEIFKQGQGVSLSPLDGIKKTPLHLALHHNKVRSALLLIRAGANLTLTDLDGNTPFDVAIDKARFDLLPFLLNPMLDFETQTQQVVPIDNPKLHYLGWLQQARLKGDIPCQILALDHLGSLELEKGELEGAAHHFNGAIQLLSQLNLPQKKAAETFLFRRLEILEATYLKNELGGIVRKRKLAFTSEQRSELAKIREEAKTALLGNQPIENVMHGLTKGYITLLANLAQEVEARLNDTLKARFDQLVKSKIGQENKVRQEKNLKGELDSKRKGQIEQEVKNQLGITNTPWCLIATGPLARGELGPYSPIPYGLLVGDKQPASKLYFSRFLKLLNLMILNMGETPVTYLDQGPNNLIEGFRICKGTHQPLYATLDEFLQRQHGWQNEHPIAAFYRTITPIYGTHSLFNSYLKSFNDTYRGQSGLMGMFGPPKTQERGLQYLKTFLGAYKFPVLKGEAYEFPDLNKYLIHPFSEIFEGLSLYYDLSATDLCGKVEELYQKKVLNIDAKNNLHKAITALYRLQCALHLDAKSESNRLAFPLPEGSLLSERPFFDEVTTIFQVLLPLHLAATALVDTTGKKNPFENNTLMNKNLRELSANNSSEKNLNIKSDKEEK